ncbi:uncharacterized protein LOC133180463 [Saccostrea echinata]|uniref:uncharacterized protein LOC133180463 n=1 Tax=Saccostrea echinata TaxID=191078 RepID=UPI002A804916|nr:uncharacterized protein LOC133180463 [Saccostrea echinata]
MFEEYAANSEKLLKVGSTQTNESFNHTVATKNPKTNFYSASESTSFRAAAAVAHKNIGLQTLTRVYENLLLSPRKHTNSYISKASRKRDYQKIVKSSVECKKSRRERKCTANKQVSSSEIKEGTTYESAIDLAGTLQPDHLQEIPDRTLPPASSSLSNDENTFFIF